MPPPCSECHAWPFRPTPSVCASATTTVPWGSPRAASFAASFMVEPVDRSQTFIGRSSSQFETETDVDCGSGVGDGADGDKIGAGLGVGADAVEIDASREFDGGAAVHRAYPFLGLLRGEIVEQQMGGARRQRLIQFSQCADFNLDRQVGGARVFDCLANSSCRGDVVVLDQYRIVETHPVVGDPARCG